MDKSTPKKKVDLMKRISFNIPNENYEAVEKIVHGLGISKRELYAEALFFFLVENKHEISEGIKLKHEERVIRKKQRQLFYFKNAIHRLYRMVEWQYRLYGSVDHDQVKDLVRHQMKAYEYLDSDVKKSLEEQAKHFAGLADERTFETYVLETMPKQITEVVDRKWKGKKQ